MRGNTIQIELPLKRGKVPKTIPLYQYDYGQKLLITGEELPVAYEVHFSNEMHGDAITSIGDSNGVEIPDSLLTTGSPVYLWLFLHDDGTDGETEFQGVIPVIKRARTADQDPTPEERSVITQVIAALNAAVTGAEAAKDAAEAAQGHIENLSVSAVSGLPESDASVTKTVSPAGEVSLAFSIPRGEKGETGDTGEQGETGSTGADGNDGFSPVVSMTKEDGVTTLSITDAVDTYTVEINDGDPSDLIDDTAGDGETDKTWSANKIHDTVASKAEKINPDFSGSISIGKLVGRTKGSGSITVGSNCAAEGINSSSFGYGTIANGAHQHVFGKYNIEDGPDTYENWVPGENYLVGSKVMTADDETFSIQYWICVTSNSDSTFNPEKWRQVSGDGTEYVEVVGNGDSAIRSNARTLDWAGNESLAGGLTLGKGTADEVTITAAQLTQLLALLN